MRGVVLDANLLLLLAVGSFEPRQIAQHRRTASHYEISDFGLLLNLISPFNKLVSMPGLLTEVSNLLGNGQDQTSNGIREAFSAIVRSAVEIHQPSATVVDMPEFERLGLSDAAQLCVAKLEKIPIITNDAPLYVAALNSKIEAVLFKNFK